MSDWQIALDHLEEKINEDLLESCLKNINSCSGGDENELKAWVSKLDHLFYYYKVDGTRFVSHIALLAKGYLKIVINVEMFLMSEAFFAELIFTIVTHNVSRMFCECSNEICVLNASRFG